MNTAVFVKDVERETRGDQRVYQLDPPLEGHEFVVVSAVELPASVHRLGQSCETYIFPSDGEEVIEYMDLPGSIKNTMDHEEALKEAGYEIVEGE